MPKLYLSSLGCNKNLVDSELMLGRLKNYELTQSINEADVLIVNTCGFIARAKEESIDTILCLHEQRKKDSLLVVCGCLSQRYKDELRAALPEVDLFSGVNDYEKIDELIASKQSHFSSSWYLQSKEAVRVVSGSSTHAYIKLSDGCNQKCSFCAIPAFKGKLRSRALKDIIAELKVLIKQGYYDFSFLAQDSSSYLLDFGIKDGLISLIKEVEKLREIKAARILYLYPSTTSLKLIDTIIASKIFVNYFDMPLQHANDKMLKLMRRLSFKKELEVLLKRMRKAPNALLRSGFIIGHPGENEEDFKELLSFLKKWEFDRVSIFAYSPEEDTKSYDMEQIPNALVNKRLDKAQAVIKKLHKHSFDALVGKKLACTLIGLSKESELLYEAKPLLWDKDIDGELLINENTNNIALKIGEVYSCLIKESFDNTLIASIEKEYYGA